jgi:2-keto-4-pentenoate hydratase/2-oxohepta-3-ene-1,7-dioic acid hydratase in catechol pathway
MFKLTEITDKGIVSTDLIPTKIIGIGYNNKKLCVEFSTIEPTEPVIFLKPPSALIGDKGTIEYPPQLKTVHFETELAVIIGERAKRVSVEDAYQYIYGYSVIQDITDHVLEGQLIDQGLPWAISKGFDTFAPIYHVVKKEKVSDPNNLEITTSVNGVEKTRGNTKDFVFKCDQLLSYASYIMTLEQGDIIATGCTSGIDFIYPGDVVEGTVQGIGTLSVTVKKVHDFPTACNPKFVGTDGNRVDPFARGSKLTEEAIKKGFLKPKK